MLLRVMSSLDQSSFFPDLSLSHAFETQVFSDNHITALIQLVSEKYITMRTQKVLKDKVDQDKVGNYIHRTRIFMHL